MAGKHPKRGWLPNREITVGELFQGRVVTSTTDVERLLLVGWIPNVMGWWNTILQSKPVMDTYFRCYGQSQTGSSGALIQGCDH